MLGSQCEGHESDIPMHFDSSSICRPESRQELIYNHFQKPNETKESRDNSISEEPETSQKEDKELKEEVPKEIPELPGFSPSVHDICKFARKRLFAKLDEQHS